MRPRHRRPHRAPLPIHARSARHPQSLRPRRQGYGQLLPPALVFILHPSQKSMTVASPNPTRISKRFAELSASGELGVIAYITAGDPSLDATVRFALALAEAGADILELGVPFSDPLADGPTIQRASERALKSGTTLSSVIELVRRIR